MGKKNLQTDLSIEVRNDAGATGKRQKTIARIWGEGHVLSNGEPAKGFYYDRKMGPVVQAVPEMKYRDWVRQGANEEKKFAAAHMRQFQVNLAGSPQKDFNAMESGENKYILHIDGEFAVETVATPVLKVATRAKDATVPEGETITRKKAILGKDKSSRSRIDSIKASMSDDTAGSVQYHDAGGALQERKPLYPKDGDDWYGTIKQNADGSSFAIYRDNDSDSKLLTAGPFGNVQFTAQDLDMNVDFRNVNYQGFMENPVQSFGASNAVTPVPRFLPSVKGASWITGLYSGLNDYFNSADVTGEYDRQNINIYDHQVIDMNTYNPQTGEDE